MLIKTLHDAIQDGRLNKRFCQMSLRRSPACDCGPPQQTATHYTVLSKTSWNVRSLVLCPVHKCTGRSLKGLDDAGLHRAAQQPGRLTIVVRCLQQHYHRNPDPRPYGEYKLPCLSKSKIAFSLTKTASNILFFDSKSCYMTTDSIITGMFTSIGTFNIHTYHPSHQGLFLMRLDRPNIVTPS